MIGCLVKLSPLDPSTGLRVDVYASSMGRRGDAGANGLNGQVWEPAIKQAPTLGIELWNGDFTAAVSAGSATFPLDLSILKNTFTDIREYIWVAAPVVIYTGDPADAWPWDTAFIGRVSNYEGSYPTIQITAEVDTEPFDADLLTDVYAGTGGAEGGADLKNRPKPLVLGWAMNVEPVPVDIVNSVYQFSGYGPIEEVTTLYERGSAFAAGAFVSDYVDYTALVAATIPAGKWGSCLAEGMIRLGAPAFGIITADIKGHEVSGSTPRLPGAVISALATLASVSSGLIESTSLSALDTDKPYPINLVLNEQASFIDVASDITLSCNWQAGISLASKFFAAGIDLAATSTITLDGQGASDPQVAMVEEMSVSAPYYRTVMGANRSWRVHSADEIAYATALVYRGLYDAAATYREGEWVDIADGSTWLYTSTTPTAGNAPPTWPTASNTWWENRSPPLSVTATQSAPVFIYQRATSAPTLPSATATYTFATGGLTGLNNGWTVTVPTGVDPLWMSRAVASSSSATDTIASGEWAAAANIAPGGGNSDNSLTPDTPSITVQPYVAATWDNGNKSIRLTFTLAFNSDPTHKNSIDGYEIVEHRSTGSGSYAFNGSDLPGERRWSRYLLPGAATGTLTFDEIVNQDAPANLYYQYAIYAIRKVNPGIDASGVKRSAAAISTTPFQPSATQNWTGAISGVTAANIGAMFTNYNGDNDQNPSTPTAPTSVVVGAPTLNNDGSADVSVGWSFTNNTGATNAANIDGFMVGLYPGTGNISYVPATHDASIIWQQVSPTARGVRFPSVAADKFYTAIVKSIRVVARNVATVGYLESAAAQNATAAQPTASPNSLIKINGEPAANVASGAIRANIAINGSNYIDTARVLTGSIASNNIDLRTYASSGSTVSLTEQVGGDTTTQTSAFSGGDLVLSATGSKVEVQGYIPVRLRKTNPVNGTAYSMTIEVALRNVTISSDMSGSPVWTLEETWQNASATGTFDLSQILFPVRWLFTGLTSGHTFRAGYKISVTATNGAQTVGTKYLLLREPRAST